MIVPESVLVESRSARDSRMANVTHERAEDATSKAKALMYFAVVYQGNKIATTKQVAEFYEVTEDVVRMAYSRHKDEFALDGIQELKGKALKTLLAIDHNSLLCPNSVTRLTAWTPRGTVNTRYAPKIGNSKRSLLSCNTKLRIRVSGVVG